MNSPLFMSIYFTAKQRFLLLLLLLFFSQIMFCYRTYFNPEKLEIEHGFHRAHTGRHTDTNLLQLAA